MKQLKALLFASIAMLFTTYANAVNMAPIISYLLSETVEQTSLNDFNMILDVNESIVTGDWKVLSSANDTATAVVLTHGLYGSFEVIGDSLTYTKITETNATDTGLLEIMEGTKTTEIVVSIYSLYWKQVSAGLEHTTAIKSDGTLWAWGDNYYGQLGDGTEDDSLVPSQEFTESTNWALVSAGEGHTVAIKSDGTLWAWGDNSDGQLGDNTEDDSLTPTQEFTEASNWSLVSAGMDHTVALKSDGTLWAWGWNWSGQLGDGSEDDKSIPVQEDSNTTNWSSVSAGEEHTAAIKSDGSLWTWGGNYYGQLGNNTTDKSPVPVREDSNATDWSSVSTGSRHTVAIKSDGTLWAWGDNGDGQLGDGSGGDTSVPIQEDSNTTNWSTVNAGNGHTVAIKSDGSLWAWGDNWSGQLGDGTEDSRYVPTREDTASSNWSTVNGGEEHTVAIKSDGTLWAWGANYTGQLGDGTTDAKSSPTPILTRDYD